jgi:hypothetical protein
MVVQAPLRFLQLLAAAGLFVACSSAPSLRRDLTVGANLRTTVQLVAVSSKLTLTLQNDSAGHAGEVYGRNSQDPSKKVVPDADLQALLDVFSEKGMFEHSLPAVPPDARDVLAVDHDGRRWIWARRQRGMQADEQLFHEARAYFLSLYNSNIAYHGTGEDRVNFGSESAKAKSSAAEARARLEEARRRSR